MADSKFDIADEEIEVAAAELLNRHSFDWYKTESMARIIATKAARELLVKDRELDVLRKSYIQQLKDQKAHYEEAVAVALRGEVTLPAPATPVDEVRSTVEAIADSLKS